MYSKHDITSMACLGVSYHPSFFYPFFFFVFGVLEAVNPGQVSRPYCFLVSFLSFFVL